MITFKKVTKKFGDGTVALDCINLDIEPQDFVFVVGSSGAGKTTLIKLLIREILPTKGRVLVDNEDLAKIKKRKIPQLRRKIGVAFQDFKLLFDRTVFENIALPLEILHEQTHQVENKVKKILKMVGLKDRANLFPVQLSGGEIQRTVIARAIVGQPKILFADEPTGNLDFETAIRIVDLLKQINKQGTTVIMATHNVSIVDEMKERVVRLGKGKIVSDKKEGKYKK